MKDLLKKIIIFKLKFLAKYYLKLKRVEVIAITGSAGKTTTKVALWQFLNPEEVYVPVEGYNTEIGVPLVIFQEKVPERVGDLFAWTAIIWRSFLKFFSRAPYKKIVLEMGADHPGDIKYLTSFIKPKIAIITTVLPVHTEEFLNIENIAKEKGYLVEALKKDGIAILNSDNKYVRLMSNRTNAKIVWVGQDNTANIRWENVTYKKTGINFDLFVRGQKYKVKTKIIAPQLLPSILSALGAALALNYEISELLPKIVDFEPEMGRMRLFEGVNGSRLIDDSYNANPESVLAALEVLNNIEGERKIAALGSMNELGELERSGHQNVGKRAAEVAELVVTVGELAEKYLAPEVKKYKTKVKSFEDSKQAGKFLQKELKQGDVVLFKGSQNKIFMEEALKMVLKDPEHDGAFLVRQSKMWEDKKRKFFERKES
jgi:UDP-N-acetylmuramoyl-tripeptide--D-alanyl-D-alanine ligase